MKQISFFSIVALAATCALAAPRLQPKNAHSVFSLSSSVSTLTPSATVTDSASEASQSAAFENLLDQLNSTGTLPSSNFNNESSPISHQSGSDEYVVLFDQDHDTLPEVEDVLKQLGLDPKHPDIKHIYNNPAFRGFAGTMKSHCVDALNAMSAVKYVEKSVQISSLAKTRKNAPWGLQRISTSSKAGGDPTRMQYIYNFDLNPGNVGKGVDIYIVDTGINTDHLAFSGRARMGFSKDGPEDLNAAADQDGHGTHCAGTAAADVFGVASGANLIGVKVLGADGSGASTDTIKGLDWLVKNHIARKGQPGFVGSVASMSWGLSQRSNSVDQAIAAIIKQGVHVSVAAGNQGVDACIQTPSANGGTKGPAVSVGAINNNDILSSFSNTGTCVDVYAPGESVISTWIDGVTTVNTLAGTSMACPHVTGLMAYLIAQEPKLAASPAALKAHLKSTANKSVKINRAIGAGDLGLVVNNGQTGLGRRIKRSFSFEREWTMVSTTPVLRY